MERHPRRGHSGAMTRTLTRPRDDRWIAGVCSGLGHRFGIDPKAVRIAFVISCLLPGPQFLIYILLWVLMPADD